MAERRYFKNPFPDYKANDSITVDRNYIIELIQSYLNDIFPIKSDRGDLYVGNAGIAYMILKLCQSNEPLLATETTMKMLSRFRNSSKHYLERKRDRSPAFICGAAGIHVVSAAILDYTKKHLDEKENDLKVLESQLNEVCSPTMPDEILYGRAGFLSGVLWLNQQMTTKPFSTDFISQICQKIVDNGRAYSQRHDSPLPLMYEWHGSEYLGAAHGVSGILLVLLMSPWFEKVGDEFPNIQKSDLAAVKSSIDKFLEIQDADGNWPTRLTGSDKKLVHWCHGVAGCVYLFAKSYLVFGEQKYMDACKQSADLVWEKGLLVKGPGICHGVAGNGYVFLVMYRLTLDRKYLYRANKFAEFLSNTEFRHNARTPDRPCSLYEGTAGTVCFLLDLLNPEKAAFPFMNIF